MLKVLGEMLKGLQAYFSLRIIHILVRRIIDKTWRTLLYTLVLQWYKNENPCDIWIQQRWKVTIFLRENCRREVLHDFRGSVGPLYNYKNVG